MLSVETLLLITQVQLFLIFVIIMYHVISSHHHRKRTSSIDPLLKHVKDYIAEGHTLTETQEKLKNVGFSKHRITKVMHDFLKN